MFYIFIFFICIYFFISSLNYLFYISLYFYLSILFYLYYFLYYLLFFLSTLLFHGFLRDLTSNKHLFITCSTLKKPTDIIFLYIYYFLYTLSTFYTLLFFSFIYSQRHHPTSHFVHRCLIQMLVDLVSPCFCVFLVPFLQEHRESNPDNQL